MNVLPHMIAAYILKKGKQVFKEWNSTLGKCLKKKEKLIVKMARNCTQLSLVYLGIYLILRGPTLYYEGLPQYGSLAYNMGAYPKCVSYYMRAYPNMRAYPINVGVIQLYGSRP